MEPTKCGGWFWMTWAELRAMYDNEETRGRLFLPIAHLLEGVPDIEEVVSRALEKQ